MEETSRSINNRLNELSSRKASSAPLDAASALSYSAILRANILGKDKQEKVNSIVVLSKLLEHVAFYAGAYDLAAVLDEQLFMSLFSIVSFKMSTETYKAILKIAVVTISGGPFPAVARDFSIDAYLPLLDSLVFHLDTIDVLTAKLYISDAKILYNSIHLVNRIINLALDFDYDRIITLSGRLKHVKFFSIVGNLIETDDPQILDAIAALKTSYLRLNAYLDKTRFDMSIVSHQVMLTNLFIFLEPALNEFGTPASPEEYVKAGFTANPRRFVVENFSILLAMDLKVFLKDTNMTFKKKFHEDLIMSDHNSTFPMYTFIAKCTDLWLEVFHNDKAFPRLTSHILSWELMIFYSMNNCLSLWQENHSTSENPDDLRGIVGLLKSNISYLECLLMVNDNVEDCLKQFTARTSSDIRHSQFVAKKSDHAERWEPRFVEFDRNLSRETVDFVCEQRVMQLLKGSWVHTDNHADRLFNSAVRKSNVANYYFILLSPNRRFLHYKEYREVATIKPTLEEMEEKSIALKDIQDFKSLKIGDSIGEKDKLKSENMISVKGTISYEKIILLDRNSQPLLSFYTDSEVNKAVWLDGLKMLKGLVGEAVLSSETMRQLRELQEVRKNSQLLVLESEAFATPNTRGDSDTENYYDLQELETVVEGFHFK